MNKKIMNWSSHFVYDNMLKAASSVENHNISDITNSIEKYSILLLIDTSGCDMFEESYCNKDKIIQDSKYNEGEADIVKKVFLELKDQGLNEKVIF